MVAWSKSFREIKAIPFYPMCTSCAAACRTFLFPPLAKLRIFLAIISFRADKFLGVSKPFDVYLRRTYGVFRMHILCIHAWRCHEIPRRETSRCKALLNASPTIYARVCACSVASITIMQNSCFHLFRAEFSWQTMSQEVFSTNLKFCFEIFYEHSLAIMVTKFDHYFIRSTN